MTFEEIRLLIPQYLSGQLTPSEENLFEEQLSRSAELRMETEELRAIWDQLGLSSEEQPSMAMRARFYQRLNAMQRHRNDPVKGKFTPGRWGVWQQILAALGIFLLGLFAGRVHFERHNEIAQLRTDFFFLIVSVALSIL